MLFQALGGRQRADLLRHLQLAAQKLRGITQDRRQTAAGPLGGGKNFGSAFLYFFDFAADIVGDADVLLFPDIHAGNLVYKAMVHTAKMVNGNLLTGTKAPVILTSRSDSVEVKVNSIALGAVVAEKMNSK